MEIKVTINSCRECVHAGHSGAFTPGGRIPLCRHHDAPENGKVPGLHDFTDLTTKEIAEKVFGPRTITFDKIPDWCPLKKGFPY